MPTCAFCQANAQFRDRHTGQYVCPEHARLDVVAVAARGSAPPLDIRPAGPDDRAAVEALALYFWDETVVDCFDRQYHVLALPAFLACDGEQVAGLAVYVFEPEWDAAVLVILNVLPDCQGRGAGAALVAAVCRAAGDRGAARVLVATSNDDLPALALYQRHGFRIVGVVPGFIAAHHGGELAGFAALPLRDEIRLELPVRKKEGHS